MDTVDVQLQLLGMRLKNSKLYGGKRMFVMRIDANGKADAYLCKKEEVIPMKRWELRYFLTKEEVITTVLGMEGLGLGWDTASLI